VRVHQVLSAAGPHDAVSTQARAYRERFAAWGWGGRDWAGSSEPGLGGAFAPLREFQPEGGDVVLVHYSAYAPGLRRVLSLPNPMLLTYHNVTPARWLWPYDPAVGVHCAAGRAHLPEFAQAARLAAGDSELNAQELREAGARETTVIPVLLDPAALGPPGPPREPTGAPRILFVGRLAPNKRQDLVIRAFALLRRRHAPEARLVLVGGALNPAFRAALAGLAEELAPGGVEMESGLSADALAERYRTTDVFLCLSEHEGFCVPLLEAFHFGVPVVARRAAAVPEIAGDAALLAEAEDGPAVVAELLRLAAGDGELRAELRARGRRRLAAYAPERATAALKAAVERVAA
jgi:glycosyltransferase involved in cell wall biosynthesis